MGCGFKYFVKNSGTTEEIFHEMIGALKY